MADPMLIGGINKAGCHESFGWVLYIADRLAQAHTAVHRQVQRTIHVRTTTIFACRGTNYKYTVYSSNMLKPRHQQVTHQVPATPHTEHIDIRNHATSNLLISIFMRFSVQVCHHSIFAQSGVTVNFPLSCPIAQTLFSSSSAALISSAVIPA